jgi:Ca2+/Na+ antiporter
MNETTVAGGFSIGGFVAALLFGAAMLWVGGYLVSAVAYAVFEKFSVHESMRDGARSVLFSLLLAFVPLAAVAAGFPEMSLGVLAGQGMAAIGFLIGAYALARDMPVDAGLRSKELPILLGAVIVFALLSRAGMTLGRGDGAALVVLGVGCAVLFLLKSKTAPEDRLPEAKRAGFLFSYFRTGGEIKVVRVAYLALVAVLILAVGAAFVVDALGKFCAHYGICRLVMGSTAGALFGILPFVAAALGGGFFSAPKLMEGFVARAGIFNLLIGGGLVAITASPAVPTVYFRAEIPGLFGLAALFWLFVRTREVIGKFEAALVLVTYLALAWACSQASML